MSTTALTVSHRPAALARPRRRGLSLVEVMISLAITSMLLTAIAAAFHSSTQVITENDEFFRATQAARVSLNQMLTEVRRADAVAARDQNVASFTVKGITSTLLPVSRPVTSQSSMEFMRYYRYDATAHKLMLSFQDANGNYSAEHPVASNVQVAPFSWDTALDKNGAPYVTRVSIAMEVAVGNNRIRISGSAVPRRSVKYE
jgi:prepilin-type N-terminal cleavage/methylation domain-containing protein